MMDPIREFIPTLFQGKTASDKLRIWLIGCGTGEAAYALASLVLAHAAELTEPPALRLFATDPQSDPLVRAREGRYPETLAAMISPAQLAAFFTQEAHGYRVRTQLRDRVVFAQHNLFKDPPFSQLDLIACPQLHIGLEPERQARFFALLHYGLLPNGYLWLGAPANLSEQAYFQPVAQQTGLYQKQPVLWQNERFLPHVSVAFTQPTILSLPHPIDGAQTYEALYQHKLEQHTPPGLLVNTDYAIVYCSDNMTPYLDQNGDPLINELLERIHPVLRKALTLALYRVFNEQAASLSPWIAVPHGATTQDVRLWVEPAGATDRQPFALVLCLTRNNPLTLAAQKMAVVDPVLDVAEVMREDYKQTKAEALAAHQALLALNNVLLQTKAQWQASEAELKVANEELLVLNEENQANIAKLRQANQLLAEALAELQQVQQRLVQQERLSALGTMASGIAHDLNNLLAPIVGFSELLLLQAKNHLPPEKANHYLQVIHQTAQNAATVIKRLRDFYRARDEAEMCLPVDLRKVIEQATFLTRPQWKDLAQAQGVAIQLITQLQPVPLINGNSAELEELLTNLILNATDALATGGVITIRLFTRQADPSQRPAGQVVLEVSDTGVGMDQETQTHCFEPFFSTKGKHGSGLGLAIAYGIVQRHQGQIEVESTLGHGTTFRTYLPISMQTLATRHAIQRGAERPLHILVVEDEPLVSATLVDYLEYIGHSVETAANGVEGLALVHTKPFDLVITDRAMPQLNGVQLAAAIKADRNLPVILLTGFGEFMKADHEMPAGVDYIMSKPFTLDALQKALAHVINKKTRGQEDGRTGG